MSENIKELEMNIDKMLSNMPLGSVDRAISQNLYGYNSNAKNTYLPRPKDGIGHVFFTRPMLNFSATNISGHRRFISLLNTDPISYSRYTRMLLDPRIGSSTEEKVFSPIVNDQSAFIPFLSNTITNLSGWPSMELPTTTTEAGGYGQMSAQADGPINELEVYDNTATFRNINGNLGMYFFTMWVYYEALVSEGVLVPYTDFITENEYDYNTRIYRIVTDKTNKYITGICCSGASFPITIPTGNFFDFNADRPLIESNADLDIRFRSIGFRFNEELIMLEFNQTQALFNPAIAYMIEDDMLSYNDSLLSRNDPTKHYFNTRAGYSKVPHHLASKLEGSLINETFNLNFKMFPYINLHTHELEWWTETNRLNRYLKGV